MKAAAAESPPHRRAQGWVGWSSARSIAAHRPSVLACVETVLAVLAYFTAAMVYQRQGWLLLAAVVAPLLLLRSKASVAEGVAIFRRDVQIAREQPSLRSPFVRANWGLPALFMVAVLAVVLAAAGAYLAHELLPGDTTSPAALPARIVMLAVLPWPLTSFALALCTAALVPIRPIIFMVAHLVEVLAVIVGLVIGASMSAGATVAAALCVFALLATVVLAAPMVLAQRPFGGSTYRIPPAVLLVVVVGSMGALTLSGPAASDLGLVANGGWVALGLCAWLAVHFERPAAQTSLDDRLNSPFIRQLMMRVTAFTSLWSLPGGALGFWLRTLGVRIWATLRHLPAGWRALPDNWRDNLFVIDLLHPPELLPRLGRVQGLTTVTQACRSFRSSNRHWLEKIYMALQMPVSYLGLLYRWNLKSTLWLWWPLVLLFTPPFFGLSSEQLRVRTSETTRGHVARAKAFAALAIAAWLLLFRWPDFKSAAKALPMVGALVEFMLKFAPPTFGVRWIALMALSLLTLIIWLLAARLTAAYEDPLKTPDKFAALNGQALEIFLARARLIERLRIAWLVSGVVLVYASALAFGAEWYPQQVVHIFSAELLALL